MLSSKCVGTLMSLIVYHPDCVKHLTGPSHPETPERVKGIIDGLKNQNLMTRENSLLAKPAPLSIIELCHPKDYINLVQNECDYVKQAGIPPGLCMLSTGDVFISPDSYTSALLAAGAGIVALDAIMENKAKTAFCAIRPPGHHATSTVGMGFCLFNNIAITARYAKKNYNIEKILIADWDVHHGNGTQDIFYNDPSVFYFSTHEEGLYPGTGKRNEKGVGNILNCPIPGGKGSRLAVIKAFQEELTHAMEAYKPELVLISAGFDAHVADPLGNFDLMTDDYATLTIIVKAIADKFSKGRIISLLEGGYHLNALSSSVCSHVKALGL